MIRLENVSKNYSNGVEALRNVSIEIEEGEFVFIVGTSGSGKSTLVKLLLKEVEPTDGIITVDDIVLNNMKRRHVPFYRRRIGCVFQDFRLLEDRDVYENVAFAQRVLSISTKEIAQNVPNILYTVGLAEKYRCLPKHLSGGEQQRVALARALINQPAIILADEPTGNLDPQNSRELMKLLDEINERGTTVVVVTHDTAMVDMMKKRVIRMEKGVVISDERNAGYQYED